MNTGVFAGFYHGFYCFSHCPGKNSFCHGKNPTPACRQPNGLFAIQIFTALQGMQMRSSDEKALCPSVKRVN